jgi:putative MATE family efflux protein
MDRSQQLGSEKISKLLLKFSIPAIIGMLVNALYNVVDRIFIGRGVGTLGIAGITIGFPLMLILLAFAMLVGIGATALISISLGEQDKEKAEHIMGNAILLLVMIAAFISVAGLWFMDPLLKLFGASAEVLPYAKAYLRIILYGAIFQNLGFGMNNFIRAEGNPKMAMLTMLIGAVLNTILDPIFIFVFHLGIQGAAWATILSQFISAMWVIYYFRSGKSILKIYRKNFKLHIPTVGRICAIGSAPFAMQLAASVLTVILNNSLRFYGGDNAISAMGIINSISMLILMPIFGINQGAQPIIGYNYGAKQYERVKKTLRLAIVAATGVVLIGFVITRVFPEELICLFNNKDKELIAFGTHALKIFLIFLPIIGFQVVSASYFQAVGKPKQAMFLSLSRQVLLLIPALLILPRYYGLDGVFMAGPASDLVSSIITGIFIFRELRQLDQKHDIYQRHHSQIEK